MNPGKRDDDAIGLAFGLLILAIFIGLFVIALFIYPFFIGGTNVGTKLSNVPYPPAIASDVTGYEDISGVVSGVPVSNPAPDPSRMGLVTLPVMIQQFTQGPEGPPAIDMRKTRIWFTANGKIEELPLYDNRPLLKPAWTVAGKSGAGEGTSADEDDFLEPNEVFTILVYPGTPIGPGTPFSIDIRMSGQWPLTVNMTVPGHIQPEMNLGKPENIARES
jgi:hypothetical protein